MRHALLLAATALAIGACDREPKIDEKNATPAEVAQKVRESGGDQSFVRPGLWQSKVTIEKFEMPGMPPEMAQRMRTMMAQNQEHDFESCLTEDEVKQPKEDFFAGKNNQCRYERFTMGGGKVDAVMHCGRGDGSQTMQMAGTYSPENYQMQMSTRVGSDQADNAMQMQMRVEARRIGECGAKESAG